MSGVFFPFSLVFKELNSQIYRNNHFASLKDIPSRSFIRKASPEKSFFKNNQARLKVCVWKRIYVEEEWIKKLNEGGGRGESEWKGCKMEKWNLRKTLQALNWLLRSREEKNHLLKWNALKLLWNISEISPGLVRLSAQNHKLLAYNCVQRCRSSFFSFSQSNHRGNHMLEQCELIKRNSTFVGRHKLSNFNSFNREVFSRLEFQIEHALLEWIELLQSIYCAMLFSLFGIL